MLIQLLSRQHLDIDGRQRTYLPGDWVDIGKQSAIKLIEQGSAKLAESATIDLGGANCGAYLPTHAAGALAQLRRVSLNLPVTIYKSAPPTTRPVLGYDRTLVWDGSPLRIELIPVGFHFLDRWEVVCPLWSYDELACHIGTDNDREATAETIIDLRVPVYDVRAMFVRKTPDTERLMAVWEFESKLETNGTDPRLAFMRALWEVKPLMLAVPPTWMKDHEVDTTSQVGH